MFVLKNATVINGTGAEPLSDATVIVRGSRIEVVGAGMKDLDGADIVIDLKGRFVLPGFIDAHVHFGGTERFDYPGIGNRHETYDYLKNRTEALRCGVTTVRSAGDYTPEIFQFRDEVNDGLHISPRIIASGRMIQARGGHPLDTVFGSNPMIAEGACVLVDESTDLDAQIKQLVDAGTDWIKAFISEVNKLDYPTPVPRIPNEKIRQIVDIAHKYGKPCMIHVDNTRHMREAAEAGADSIEHVFAVGATETEISDELIELLLKMKTYVVPTVYSIMAHENPEGNMPLVYEKLIVQVNKLIKAGVNIGVGTDSSIPFIPVGESLHEELAQLVKCGMKPIEAITAATGGNAKLLRRENEIGAILPGYFADLVVVDGDPTGDISRTKDIVFVIMNGRIVSDNSIQSE